VLSSKHCRKQCRGGACRCRVRYATDTGGWGHEVGGVDAGKCHVAKQISSGTDESQLACKTCVPRGIGNARSTPVTIGCIGHRLAKSRPGILAVGMGPVGQPLGPFVCQRHPRSHYV
jgi:hypothetical protein